MSNPKEIRQKILQKLYETRSTPIVYPKDLFERIGIDWEKGILELDFLVNEGLVTAINVSGLNKYIDYIQPQITHEGIKRIEDGEPYSVIKLHEDTINDLRNLLTVLVTDTALPESEKSSLKKAIQNAPASAVNEAVSRLVGLGFDALVKTTPDLLYKLFGLL